MAKFRCLKIVLALLALVAAFYMFDAQSQSVYADDASSMEDISQHYSNAGGTWAASDKAGDYNEIDGVGKNWNYFGNGQSTPILTNSAKGTKTATYDALANLGNDNSKGKGSLAVAARFAYAMQQSGLDHPTTGGTSLMTVGGRFIGGWLTGLMLGGAGITQACITVTFKLFNWLNPFYALQFLVLNKGDSFTNSFFSPLINTFKSIYQDVNDMTMSVAILAFGIGILLVLMGFVHTGSQNGSLGVGITTKIMHLFIRILVMVGAPIFIGALAASLTQELETKTNVVQNIAMSQIYGNYVDFEGWAQNSRLALPDPGKSSSNKLMQGGNSAFTPEYIQQINAYGAQNSQAKDSLTDQGKENKQSTLAESRQTWSSIGTTFGWLTNNYAHGSSINGTDWESYFKTRLIKQERKYGIYKDDVKKNPFKPISDDGHYKSKFGHYGNDTGYAGGASCVFFQDFTMNYSPKKGYYSDAPGKSAAQIGSPKGAGLSSIGLYNYLNVNATASGITYTQPKTFFGWGQINQHASSGFAGKGVLFIGTYIRMVAMMITILGVVLFVLSVIWKGMMQGTTRVLLYLGQIGIGSPSGFLGVLKECIGMYARMTIGLLLVYIAQEGLGTLANRMDDVFAKVLNSATITLPIGNVQLLPFASTSWIIGFVRMFEAAGIILFVYTMWRTYYDMLHWIESLIQRIMDLLGKTQLGRSMLPTPNANASGMNSNNSNTNNANANSNDRNDANNKDGNSSDDDNNPEDLWKRSHDPNSNLGEDDGNNGTHGIVSGLKQGIKRGLAYQALDTLHRSADSKAGKALTKGASQILGTLGSTKLGHALGIKNRAQGMNLLGNAIAKAKQTQAEKIDPLHANTSKRAGLSKENQKKLDTDESHAEQKAPDSAMQRLRKQYHKAKRLANMSTDKNGQVQDTANTNELVNGLMQYHKSTGTTDSPEYKKLDHTNKAFNKAAKSEQMQRRDQADQAQAKSLENKKQVANAKLAMDSATTPQARQEAQKRYNDLKAKQPMLDQNAKKAKVLADANKQALFMNMTHRQVGAHGEGLRALSASQLKKAKDRQFTAMTGMSAKTATQADPAIMNQASTARDKALETLAKDPSEVTDTEREQAEQTLGEANTVLQTGKQYGQFASKDAAQNLEAASQDEIDQAAHYNNLDKAAVATGFTAASNADALSPAQKEFANRVTNAQQIVSTGMTTDEYGQKIEATPEQIQQAAKTLSTSPAHQIRTMQNQMMATSTSVQQGAIQYANNAAANAPKNATSADLQQIKQQAMDSYYQRPAVQKQLASAGLISETTANATPATVKQIRQTIGQIGQGAIQYANNEAANAPKNAKPADLQQIKQQAMDSYYQSPAVQKQFVSAGLLSGTTANTISTRVKQIRQEIDNVQSLGAETQAGITASLAPIRQQVNQGGIDMPSQDFCKDAAREAYNHLPACNGWVDAAHYNKTTRRDIDLVTNELIRAYKLGNQGLIKKARRHAVSKGMNMTYVSSPPQLQNLSQQIQSGRDHTVQVAMQHYSSNRPMSERQYQAYSQAYSNS